MKNALRSGTTRAHHDPTRRAGARSHSLADGAVAGKTKAYICLLAISGVILRSDKNDDLLAINNADMKPFIDSVTNSFLVCSCCKLFAVKRQQKRGWAGAMTTTKTRLVLIGDKNAPWHDRHHVS